MAYNSSDYLGMLLNLLPKGRAWTRDPSSNLYKMMSGF